MVWNWYGIGMEWYGILWNSMDQLELHKNGLSSIISPLQAAVLKTSDTGVLVELHGISVLQLDTGTCFTAHTSNFTFFVCNLVCRAARTFKLGEHLPYGP